MGRGRGKGKKQSHREDLGSGEEEKMGPVRKRGRPVKPAKGEVVVVVVEEDDEDEEEEGNRMKKNQECENGKKRKWDLEAKGNGDLGEEEKVLGSKSGDLKRAVGFRQIGSRRKNKPRRAAEVGVECR